MINGVKCVPGQREHIGIIAKGVMVHQGKREQLRCNYNNGGLVIIRQEYSTHYLLLYTTYVG